MMATFMFVIVPRAAVSSGPDPAVLDTEPSITIRRPVSPPRGGTIEFREVDFRYPGAEEPVLRRISFHGGPGRDHRDRRQHRQRKVHARQPAAALLRRERRVGARRRIDVREMDRADLWGRIGLIPRRHSCSAARSPATCATATRPPPTRTSGAPWRLRRARTSWRRWKGGSRPDHPGRHQRLRRAAPAPRDRARPGQEARRLRLRRQLLGARLPDGRRLRAALIENLADATVLIVANASGPSSMRTGSSSWTPAAWSASARTTSSCRPARPTARSCTPSSPRRRSHERPHMGGAAAGRPPARSGGPGRGGRWLRRHAGRQAEELPGLVPRLLGELRPERRLVIAVMLLAIVSVTLAILGPKILGNATNSCSTRGRQAAAGRGDQGPGGRRPPCIGPDEPGGDAVQHERDARRGRGFRRLAGVLLTVVAIYAVSSVFSWPRPT